MKIGVLAAFVLMYILMIALPKKRPYIALGTAAIFIAIGVLPLGEVFSSIDWNVVMMIAGTMVIIDFFIASKMPAFMADVILDKSPNVMWVTIYMSLFSGIVSAFIDNVATVLMVAPVALAVCKKLKISPVNMILAIAVSSNLQGAATLVGDTTSIMLGAYAGMDFTHFFWMHGKPGIFWAVELGAVATVPIMMVLFRKEKAPVEAKAFTKVEDFMPTVFTVGMVALLIAASFIPNKPSVTNGLICMTIAVVSLVYDGIRNKATTGIRRALQGVDFQTILLLMGLFLVIAGVTKVGLIDDMAKLIVAAGGENLFLLYAIIVWGSVLISAFIDNIPYVATMLPVLMGVTGQLGIEPYVLYFGLLCGATLGGNLTPIGASANITAVGMLRKEGHEVSFPTFFRIGIPFTLTAVMAGFLFIWFVWGLRV